MTQGVKYIGSKKNLLPFIERSIDHSYESLIDVFSGTTRVAQHFRKLGKKVQTSDLSWATTAYAGTYIGFQPTESDIIELGRHLDKMNALPGYEGWLSNNYIGEGNGEKEDGRCFQKKNAMRADAARDYVETVEEKYRPVLVTSIIRALDAVDNTVGIQQAYLKTWCARSHNDIEFKLPELISGPVGTHHEGNCLEIQYKEADVAYLDPPYSAHSYATYYHIWDSIARWDKPETSLKARRRVDRVVGSDNYDGQMVSPWNSRKTALVAFEELVSRLPVKTVLISYSNESLVDLADLIPILEKYGTVDVIDIDYRRNIMSQIGNAVVNSKPEQNQKNVEHIIRLKR